MDHAALTAAFGGATTRIVFMPLALAAAEISGVLGSRRYLTVTDSSVQECHGERVGGLFAGLNANFSEYVLPAGEASKTPATVIDLCRYAAQVRLDRSSAMVAIGGGVTGDLTGFAASIYMRGIAFVNVPTTLLAMVDSSVGGQTAVDLPEGKNLIGTFHQPRLVVIDVEFLGTLPPRELAGGLAEVVKYGVISDGAFFDLLESNREALLAGKPGFYREIVRRSCEFKLAIVKSDEREEGPRMLLNYGHSVGHALEKLSGYTLGHGQAVAIGMVVAARVALDAGGFDPVQAGRLRQLLVDLGLPVTVPAEYGADAILEAMVRDKKNTGGALTMILPVGFGRAEIHRGCDPSGVRAAIESCRA